MAKKQKPSDPVADTAPTKAVQPKSAPVADGYRRVVVEGAEVDIPSADFGATIHVNGQFYNHVSERADGVWEFLSSRR